MNLPGPWKSQCAFCDGAARDGVDTILFNTEEKRVFVSSVCDENKSFAACAACRLRFQNASFDELVKQATPMLVVRALEDAS